MADPMASVTPVWFMVVDHNFTCTLRYPTCVDVPFNGLVYHFLKEIKALGWEILSDASGDLNVWKLRTPLPSQDVNQECLAKLKDQEYLEKRGDGYEEEGKKKRKPKPKGKGKEKAKPEEEKQEGAFALLLEPDDKISSHFEELTVHDSENKIHILVQVPATGKAGAPQDDSEHPLKRRRLADDPNSTWLEEVHSKIWDKKELEPKLFRTVNITQGHYTELQERLKQRHPDRDLPLAGYDGRLHNVRSLKLEFLQSITPLPPQRPDNNEVQAGDGDDLRASDEDGFGIGLFFPFNLSYLDLSSLDLKKELPAYIPSPLFLRPEYNHISTLIDKEPRNDQGSVIVSGQPGTGKTAYLYLRIIQSMIQGRPFLYQASNGAVYSVNENGVQAIRSWEPHDSEGIVAFVDGNEDNYDPNHMLRISTVQIILASSPRGANRGWIKRAGVVLKLAIELWSPRELFLTGVFLYPFDISPQLLWESTSYFGCNPCLCFMGARSVNVLERTKMDVMSRIRDVAVQEGDILQLLRSSRTGDSEVSHSIFQISPKDESRLLAQCELGAVSRWALDHLLEVCRTQQADAVADFYHYISRASNTASLWGHVLERQVLDHLDGMEGEHEFPIHGLTSSGEMTWIYRGPIPRFTFLQDLDFIDKLTNAVQNNRPLHLVPLVRNFPAVDSIVYVPNESLTCVQTTTRREHPIAVRGLQRIQSWLKEDTPLAHLHPSNERPWRLIFIVPSDEVTFELRQSRGDTAQGEWAGKVHQYVLRLNPFG